MKRFLLPLAALISACSLTSCFQNETTLQLKKDGSGTLTEETVFGAQVVQMLEQVAQMTGGGGNSLADLSSETKANARAAAMGEGVTVEKVEALGTDGGKGARVTYHFTDINKLKFTADSNIKSAIPTMPGAPPAAVAESKPTTFTYAGDKLTISMPEPEKPEVPAERPPIDEAALNDPAAQTAMKEMAAGARISLKIIIEPGISETNATYVDGDTITLTDMDIGKMMENPENMKKMSGMSQNPAEALDELKKIEGVKVESKRELTVTVK